MNKKCIVIPITGHEAHGGCGCKSHSHGTTIGRGRMASPMLGRLYPRGESLVLVL